MTYKILVVDDEKMTKMLFEFLFEEKIKTQIYQFLFASDGIEALEILEKISNIALLITDIRMPKMDGLTLMKNLQEKQIKLPIFVISAYDKETRLKEVQKLGATDFINKPINFSEMNSKIQAILNKNQGLSQ